MAFKLRNPFANDPFLKTTLTLSLGAIGIDMAATWAFTQLGLTDGAIIGALPFIAVVMGTWYLMRFIGARPLFHAFLFGATVGFGFVTYGFLLDEFIGLSINGVVRYIFLVPAASLGLGLPALVVGWIKTRGRTPIAIEIPDKKELQAAIKAGKPEPAPRILTPVSQMPGSAQENKKLLEQLKKDPEALMSEKQKAKLKKQQAKVSSK